LNRNSLGLGIQARIWPTPAAQQYGGTAEQHLARKAKMKGGARTTVTELNAAVQMWQTPRAGQHGQHGQPGMHNGKPDALEPQVKQWATPTSRDYKGSSATSITRADGKSRLDLLDYQAEQSFRPAPTTPTPGAPSSSSGPTSRPRLNPAFACWLMGWPEWWTHPEPISCAASAMELWRSKLQRQLDYYCGE
jgi:hypothetical protein